MLLFQLAAIVTLPFDVIKTHRQVELGEIEVYAGGSFISLTCFFCLHLITFDSLYLHLFYFVSFPPSLYLHHFIVYLCFYTFIFVPLPFSAISLPLSLYFQFETPSSLYRLPFSFYFHLFTFVSLPPSF